MQASQLSTADRVYRSTGKITLGVLTLCLILGTIAFSLGWLFPLGDDYYVKLYPSPSGHMKAAHVSRSGGGGISPYCTEAIAVAPASTNEAEIMAQRFEVYSSGDCDAFADHSISPIIEWISDERLRIIFSINRTGTSMKTVQLKKQDLSGRTSIDFAARP